MALFNAIVNSPDDLEFRMHLRNEMFVMGADDLIDVGPASTCAHCGDANLHVRAPWWRQLLRQVADVDLDTQLNVFEDEALADEELLLQTLNIDDVAFGYPPLGACTHTQRERERALTGPSRQRAFGASCT
jgi:hypothetical protein